MNEHYDRAIDIFTDTMRAVKEAKIPKRDFVNALADFTAAVCLMAAGEPCLDVVIYRMKGRAEDFKAGTFPAPHDADFH